MISVPVDGPADGVDSVDGVDWTSCDEHSVQGERKQNYISCITH